MRTHGDLLDTSHQHSRFPRRLGATCYSSSECQVYLEGATHLLGPNVYSRGLVYLWRLVYSGRLVARLLKDKKEVAMEDSWRDAYLADEGFD